MKKTVVILMLIFTYLAFSKTKEEEYKELEKLPGLNNEIGAPTLPNTDLDEINEFGERIGTRVLEKNMTIILENKVNVFVPLEIISDIDIETLIVDNEKVKIPFEVEFNKIPKKKDYYKLHYSENKIDIDNDGQIDTYIYSTPYINTKIKKDNVVYIDGEKISKEGTFKKKIYMTIEVVE